MIRELICVGTKNKCNHNSDSEYAESYETADKDDCIFIPLLVDLSEVAAAYPALDDDGNVLKRTYIALYNGSVFCINNPHPVIFNLIKDAKREDIK